MNIKEKIGVIYTDSEEYPTALKQIPDPPKQLYFIGDPALLKKNGVAVVGARKASSYGIWAANEIGKRLALNGVVTVSGMAAGIDAMSHRGALSVGGDTIAVLGCGIDICFPAFNRKLRDEIAEKGLILSEYPKGYPGSKYTFPQRNRIISGISMGTVIVEAGMNSGSLITAERAAEQGKTVFSVPGNINSIYSLGTNKLIQDGAFPLAIIDDIFSVLHLEKKANDHGDGNLGSIEKRVVELIQSSSETTTDRIAYETGLTIAQVNAILTILEIKGLIYSAMGKIFIAN